MIKAGAGAGIKAVGSSGGVGWRRIDRLRECLLCEWGRAELLESIRARVGTAAARAAFIE
ncbi:hypothetical protein UK15_11710 [Streptomyces variegatus]|uniref:Uncharacterized protein n=1 Tax=Streptomyces variegatus TaxID=284040 RepID=A0A0M2GU65_9ACTN|nr:hypothetical protein UK15_11710 [Streptomyces variegatus]